MIGNPGIPWYEVWLNAEDPSRPGTQTTQLNTDAAGAPTSSLLYPVETAELPGTFFHFDAAKGALRAGAVSGDQWTDARRGACSVALGRDTAAGGADAVALGAGADAAHDGAFVFGDGLGADVASNAPGQAVFGASGGFTVYSDAARTVGVALLPGAAEWAPVGKHAGLAEALAALAARVTALEAR